MSEATQSGYLPVKTGHKRKIKIFDQFNIINTGSKRSLRAYFFDRRKELIGPLKIFIVEFEVDERKNIIKIDFKKNEDKIDKEELFNKFDFIVGEVNDDLIEKSQFNLTGVLKNSNKINDHVSPEILIGNVTIENKPAGYEPVKDQQKIKKISPVLISVLVLIPLIIIFLIVSYYFNATKIAATKIIKTSEGKLLKDDTAVIENVTDIKKINSTKMYFNPDSVQLLPDQLVKLDVIASHLNKFPKDILVIEGHEHRVGPGKTRGLLSKKRAERIKNILQKKLTGNQILKVKYYGNTRPAVHDAQTPEDKMKNRRVNFKLISSKNLEKRGRP